MLWIVLSVLAGMFWAVVNIVDKFTVTKWVRNPLSPVVITSVIGAIAALLIWSVHGLSELSAVNVALSLACGLFYILACVFYMKALKIEEVSRVIPLWYLQALFTMVLAAAFLGEALTTVKYAGVVMLVVGAMAISSKKLSFRLNKMLLLMLLADLAMAANAVISKYLLGFADFWTVFSYTRLGALLAAVPIFFFAIPDLRRMVREHGRISIGVNALSSSLNLSGVLLLTIATAIGSVTLVNALSGVQQLFVLAFTVMLSVLYPRIMKEETDRRTVLAKLAAITVMLAGAALIT